MDELERVPQECYHFLPWHSFISNATPIQSLSLEAQGHLWHQRLILLHCGDFNFKNLHEKVDGIPDLSKFKMD